MPCKNKIRKPVNKSLDKIKRHNKSIKKKYKRVPNINKKRIVPGVSIIVGTNKPEYISNIFYNYERQNYKMKELIIVLNNNKIEQNHLKEISKKYKNVKVFQLDEEKSAGECLNYAVEQSKYDIIAKFDDNDYYAPNYLKDSIKYFKKTDASVIGKAVIYVYFEDTKILAVKKLGDENNYVKYVHGPTIIFKRKVFEKVKFKHLDIGEDGQFCRDCYENGFKIYSTDRNNFVYLRHKSLDQHYWKISNDELLKKCVVITKTNNYRFWE